MNLSDSPLTTGSKSVASIRDAPLINPYIGITRRGILRPRGLFRVHPWRLVQPTCRIGPIVTVCPELRLNGWNPPCEAFHDSDADGSRLTVLSRRLQGLRLRNLPRIGRPKRSVELFGYFVSDRFWFWRCQFKTPPPPRSSSDEQSVLDSYAFDRKQKY